MWCKLSMGMTDKPLAWYYFCNNLDEIQFQTKLIGQFGTEWKKWNKIVGTPFPTVKKNPADLLHNISENNKIERPNQQRNTAEKKTVMVKQYGERLPRFEIMILGFVTIFRLFFQMNTFSIASVFRVFYGLCFAWFDICLTLTSFCRCLLSLSAVWSRVISTPPFYVCTS